MSLEHFGSRWGCGKLFSTGFEGMLELAIEILEEMERNLSNSFLLVVYLISVMLYEYYAIDNILII